MATVDQVLLRRILRALGISVLSAGQQGSGSAPEQRITSDARAI